MSKGLVRPGPLARRLLIHKPTVRFAARNLTGSELTMYDGVTVSNLPVGGSAYAGYYNGTFANFSEVVSRFPGKHHLSITPDGANGAMCDDIEPGNVGPANAPFFYHNASHGGALKPWIYTMASWMVQVQDALANAGISRDRYFLWSAHYIGAHLCGPRTCGYGLSQADATQYASNARYDTSLVNSYCFATPPPVTTYGPPTNLQVRPGHTSVELSWTAPPALKGVPADTYSVFIYRGTATDKNTILPTYPRTVIGATSHQEGGLQEHTTYTVHVTAGGPGNAHVRPMTFATAEFTTG